MATTNSSLMALLAYIDANRLVLPEIQRDFVWNKKNVLLLFDSLYRGLPIGYMLVWKAKVTVAHRPISTKRKAPIGQPIENFYGYLLDGQQRLTALRLVRDGDERYPLVFSLLPNDANDADSDRFHFRARWNNNPYYISVSEVLDNQVTPLQVVDQLKELDDFDYSRHGETVLASLTRLKGVMDYNVGIIDFEDDDYRKATELFIRFNSTGKKLNRSDLAASELALTVPTLISERINRASTQFAPQFNFTKPFLIQCLAAVHAARMNFSKPREIWGGSDEAGLKRSWEKTEKGLGRTIELLTGTVKWDSTNWLPSINSIIPLVYLSSQDKFNKDDRILARNWLLMANLFAIFSGAVHTKLDNIVRKLKREPSVSRLWDFTKKEFSKIRPEHFETGRKSGGAMAAYISLIRSKNAKDWQLDTSLGGDVIGHNAQLQVHHFFPRALLQKNGFNSEQINTLANYVIINKETNLEISSKEPIEYIDKLGIQKRHLACQSIPLKKDLWTVDKYEEFLSERRDLLAKEMNRFVMT
jgi:hypothetical protein